MRGEGLVRDPRPRPGNREGSRAYARSSALGAHVSRPDWCPLRVYSLSPSAIGAAEADLMITSDARVFQGQKAPPRPLNSVAAVESCGADSILQMYTVWGHCGD
eukprot:1033334-Prorocentrum_minimum.AAC.2